MRFDKNGLETICNAPDAATNHGDRGPNRSKGAEPDWAAFAGSTRVSVADFNREVGSPAVCGQHEINGCFKIQTWHRVYAETLMETETTRLRVLIDDSERAILSRLVQLSGALSATDEILDLRNAADALSKLRRTNRAVGS